MLRHTDGAESTCSWVGVDAQQVLAEAQQGEQRDLETGEQQHQGAPPGPLAGHEDTHPLRHARGPHATISLEKVLQLMPPRESWAEHGNLVGAAVQELQQTVCTELCVDRSQVSFPATGHSLPSRDTLRAHVSSVRSGGHNHTSSAIAYVNLSTGYHVATSDRVCRLRS